LLIQGSRASCLSAIPEKTFLFRRFARVEINPVPAGEMRLRGLHE